MKILVSMLLIVFVNVYISARASSTKTSVRLRTFILALIATAVMSIQLFYFMPPPNVNYWQVGWIGYIRYLNQEAVKRGSPYLIPDPGGNQ